MTVRPTLLLAALLAAPLAPLHAQAVRSPRKAPAAAPAAARPAAIRSVAYAVTFTRALAKRRAFEVRMTFDVGGPGDVDLSLPAWTPGAYEISDFAKWLSGFTPMRGSDSLRWNKVDYDTWRLRNPGAGPVTLRYEIHADTLDNAMAWSRDEFLLFNGTTAFLYPEGQGFDWPATVSVATEDDWLVATGMTPAGTARTWGERNYHDLVDMPFLVGRFDLDSTEVDGVTLRLASYPAGNFAGEPREAFKGRLRKMLPPMVQAFGAKPFRTYTVMQIADSSFQGGSGLEHQNSHVDVVTPPAVGSNFLDGLYAHEIVHAWNVKRIRPADLWPYRYDRPQPTEWLWVSEGITDYYADLVLVRAGLVEPAGFYATTSGKIQNVAGTVPVALTDASLSTWIHPTDGTGYLYYDKGSLAGLMLDIWIRDASDNRQSLDDVFRSLYRDAYAQGRGFTPVDFWSRVSRAAGGRSFANFGMRFVAGREAYPWTEVLPLAGLRIVQEPRLGVGTRMDSAGTVVTQLAPTGAAAAAGVQLGDEVVQVGDVVVKPGVDFGFEFRQRYTGRAGEPIAITVRRNGQLLTLNATVRTVGTRVEEDPDASPKAVRIRTGILTGTTDR